MNPLRERLEELLLAAAAARIGIIVETEDWVTLRQRLYIERTRLMKEMPEAGVKDLRMRPWAEGGRIVGLAIAHKAYAKGPGRYASPETLPNREEAEHD
jgi:hypothetical protein